MTESGDQPWLMAYVQQTDMVISLKTKMITMMMMKKAEEGEEEYERRKMKIMIKHK